jgi:hypothetical protein
VHVVDDEGAVVAKATVSAESETQTTASDSDTTDTSGDATVAALKGASLLLRVEADGFTMFERRRVLAGSEPLRIELTRTK